jgi:hypothetical protein
MALNEKVWLRHDRQSADRGADGADAFAAIEGF